MKKMILDLLSQCRNKFLDDLFKLQDNKSCSFQFFSTVEAKKKKEKELTIKITDNKKVFDMLSIVEFVENKNKLKECRSPYGTFFNGKQLFYDRQIMDSLSINNQLVVILNELFNVLQGYYGSGKRLSNSKSNFIKNNSLLSIYHVGALPRKCNVRYSSMFRSELYEMLIDEYPLINIPLFGPNKENSTQLLHDLMVNKNEKLGIVSNELSIENIVSGHIKVNKLHITKSNGIKLYRVTCNDNLRVYYNINTMSKTRRKEDIESIKVIEKLAQ